MYIRGDPMKLLRKLTAFILAFGLLSGTVAAMSAAVYVGDAPDEESDVAVTAAQVPDTATDAQTPDAEDDLSSTGAGSYTPRLTAPSYSNPYYYSDKNTYYEYGWGMPNCTCYAWGRAYELLGSQPKLCLYSAHLWYDYNLEYGYYPCGSEPKLGAIACWKYTSGTSGHVAVVEKIENGKITFSNSAWSGTEFYIDTVPIDDPSDGRKTWIFQGYIYIGDFGGSDEPADKPSVDDPSDELSDDFELRDVYRITSEDGVNLRSSAGTGYSVVNWLYYREIVTVTAVKTAGGYTWGYTESNGKTGWFALDYAERTESEPAVTAADDPSLTVGGYLMGDVDGDGRITILDATDIQRILARLIVPTDYMLTVGDFDGDNYFSVMDAGRIRYYLAGKTW